jgi:hypothetical protein
MYSQGFVACILAGFEGTIDTLISGVDGQVRIELEDLAARIADTRLRLDPEMGDDPETDQMCPARGGPKAQP